MWGWGIVSNRACTFIADDCEDKKKAQRIKQNHRHSIMEGSIQELPGCFPHTRKSDDDNEQMFIVELKKKQNKQHLTKQTHREQTVGCQRLRGWGMNEIGEGD